MARSEYLATSFRIAIAQFHKREDRGQDLLPTDAFSRGMLQGFAIAVNAFGIWKDGCQRIGAQDLNIPEAVQMAIDSLETERSEKGDAEK